MGLIPKTMPLNLLLRLTTGDLFLVRISIALSKSMKSFPLYALGIGDPAFIGIGITAGGFFLVTNQSVCAIDVCPKLLQFFFRLSFNAPMLNSFGALSFCNRKIQARIIKHPLGIILLLPRGLDTKKRPVKFNRFIRLL